MQVIHVRRASSFCRPCLTQEGSDVRARELLKVVDEGELVPLGVTKYDLCR